jgi:tripartite-type tricarboxylate transporter receptor subunit TctC
VRQRSSPRSRQHCSISTWYSGCLASEDNIPRIAGTLSQILDRQVVVENVTGAGGTIGSNRVAKAAPDGYQFVFGHIGTHVLARRSTRNPSTML